MPQHSPMAFTCRSPARGLHSPCQPQSPDIFCQFHASLGWIMPYEDHERHHPNNPQGVHACEPHTLCPSTKQPRTPLQRSGIATNLPGQWHDQLTWFIRIPGHPGCISRSLWKTAQATRKVMQVSPTTLESLSTPQCFFSLPGPFPRHCTTLPPFLINHDEQLKNPHHKQRDGDVHNIFYPNIFTNRYRPPKLQIFFNASDASPDLDN